MPYSYATLNEASLALGNRLYDPLGLFWTDAERQAYIIEALRAWNAHANFWRSEFEFPSTQGIIWYDFTDISNLPNTLRPLTVTDQQIYSLIEYHLLEPQTATYPLTWTGSNQFGLGDIMQAVARVRDEILSTTGCLISRLVVDAIPGRTFLPDSVIDIRRVAWIPVSNPEGFVNTPLLPGDNFGETSFAPSYTVSPGGTPGSYLRSAQPPLSFDVDIPPAIPGQYECLVVEAGSNLSDSKSSTLSIPDDFTWLIKWGALADLLNRESNARDAMRAKYCELRYRQGLAVLLAAPALLSMRLNNVPLETCAAIDQDYFNPSWQAASQGAPTVALVAGLNMIGLSVPPDAGPYSITASVVQNAPIPASSGFIQIGRDEYDAVLDEAQHLASFKQGGEEFSSTLPLHSRFLKQAAIYNQKLNALGQFSDLMLAMSQMEASFNPILASDKVVKSG